ncbi:hypothetical protein LRY65_02665 [Candidatus Woesebacteria bacterium]|nr:hypothetical protein [Candidatus Woesebacteria bacterium]MCD8507069.1 hypothetical protein [Candidatus Woesebacteria bacterium]MCD8527096.1 hypothetical protein [Candidatus Woesebacteria bacterium]MCD8546725.1 hypothetical protein [Candidatus Woesebacteria bacterium]
MAAKSTAVAKQPRFFIGETLGEAWKILRENVAEIVAIYLLGIILPQGILMALGGRPEDGSVLFAILNQIVSIILSFAVLKAMLDVVRGKDIDVSITWKEPKRLWNYFLGSMLYAIIVLVGFVLFIIPGIIFSIKYRYLIYLVIEEDLGPLQAMKRSAEITKGIKWDLLAFDLVTVAVAIAGFLALLVGLVVAIPLIALAQVVLYTKLAARVEA